MGEEHLLLHSPGGGSLGREGTETVAYQTGLATATRYPTGTCYQDLLPEHATGACYRRYHPPPLSHGREKQRGTHNEHLLLLTGANEPAQLANTSGR